MHVSQKPPLAALLMLALAGLGGAAHAVQFEEKLKAPAMKNVGELRSQAQTFVTKHGEVRVATPSQLITNAGLARQQFDLKWQIQHAIDERQPLDDLAALGIVSRGDGSYAIDLGLHPEWDDLPETIVALLSGSKPGSFAPDLTQRGFRPQDVETLNQYVATHDGKAASAAASLPVALGFGRAVKKYDEVKFAVPDSLVLSYWYQRARVRSETNRVWVDGLLGRLDAQRGRVLLAFFLELKSQAVWAPDNIAAGIADTVALARQPDYEQRVTAEAKGVAP